MASQVFYAKHAIYENGLEPETEQELKENFSKVWETEETNLERIYARMQGDGWFPEELQMSIDRMLGPDGGLLRYRRRSFLDKLGVERTSMSIGDLVKQGDALYVVATFGFEKCGVWDEEGNFYKVDFGASRKEAVELQQFLIARREAA